MDMTQLIKLAADDIGLEKVAVRATLTAAFKIIRGAVASGETVELPDFGTFKASHTPGIDIRVVRFIPAESFRKEVNDHHS